MILKPQTTEPSRDALTVYRDYALENRGGEDLTWLDDRLKYGIVWQQLHHWWRVVHLDHEAPTTYKGIGTRVADEVMDTWRRCPKLRELIRLAFDLELLVWLHVRGHARSYTNNVVRYWCFGERRNRVLKGVLYGGGWPSGPFPPSTVGRRWPVLIKWLDARDLGGTALLQHWEKGWTRVENTARAQPSPFELLSPF